MGYSYARLALEDGRFEQRLADRWENNINENTDDATDGLGLWNWWWVNHCAGAY